MLGGAKTSSAYVASIRSICMLGRLVFTKCTRNKALDSFNPSLRLSNPSMFRRIKLFEKRLNSARLIYKTHNPIDRSSAQELCHRLPLHTSERLEDSFLLLTYAKSDCFSPCDFTSSYLTKFVF